MGALQFSHICSLRIEHVLDSILLIRLSRGGSNTARGTCFQIHIQQVFMELIHNLCKRLERGISAEFLFGKQMQSHSHTKLSKSQGCQRFRTWALIHLVPALLQDSFHFDGVILISTFHLVHICFENDLAQAICMLLGRQHGAQEGNPAHGQFGVLHPEIEVAQIAHHLCTDFDTGPILATSAVKDHKQKTS